jgi:hypothetical protein
VRSPDQTAGTELIVTRCKETWRNDCSINRLLGPSSFRYKYRILDAGLARVLLKREGRGHCSKPGGHAGRPRWPLPDARWRAGISGPTKLPAVRVGQFKGGRQVVAPRWRYLWPRRLKPVAQLSLFDQRACKNERLFQTCGPTECNIEKRISKISPFGLVLTSEGRMVGIRCGDHERIDIGEMRDEDAGIASRNHHDFISHRSRISLPVLSGQLPHAYNFDPRVRVKMCPCEKADRPDSTRSGRNGPERCPMPPITLRSAFACPNLDPSQPYAEADEPGHLSPYLSRSSPPPSSKLTPTAIARGGARGPLTLRVINGGNPRPRSPTSFIHTAWRCPLAPRGCYARARNGFADVSGHQWRQPTP